LWNPALGERENVEIFAECANPAGHGHLYRVEVTCRAGVTSGRPVVLDRRAVIDLVDGVLKPKLQNANMDAVFGIENFISTGENVTRAVWRLIEPHIPANVRLVSVRLIETPKNSFVYMGEEPRARAVPMT
jgi:6-pyruvoyl-tetrahydropterin synthase